MGIETNADLRNDPHVAAPSRDRKSTSITESLFCGGFDFRRLLPPLYITKVRIARAE